MRAVRAFLFRLMNLTDGGRKDRELAEEVPVAIEFNGICKVTADHIGKSVSHVLMEGFRLKDERKRAADARGLAPANEARQASITPLVPATPRPATKRDSADSARKADRMASIRSILEEFTKLQGVTAVCLVGRDGFLLDSIAGRGIDCTIISDLNQPWGQSESCTSCGKCVLVCPTGALVKKGESVAEMEKHTEFLKYIVTARRKGEWITVDTDEE